MAAVQVDAMSVPTSREKKIIIPITQLHLLHVARDSSLPCKASLAELWGESVLKSCNLTHHDTKSVAGGRSKTDNIMIVEAVGVELMLKIASAGHGRRNDGLLSHDTSKLYCCTNYGACNLGVRMVLDVYKRAASWSVGGGEGGDVVIYYTVSVYA